LSRFEFENLLLLRCFLKDILFHTHRLNFTKASCINTVRSTNYFFYVNCFTLRTFLDGISKRPDFCFV